MQCSTRTNDDLLPPVKTLTVLKDKKIYIYILYMQIARVIISNPATIIILLLQGDGNFFA